MKNLFKISSLCILFLMMSCNQDDTIDLKVDKQNFINYSDKLGKQDFDYDFYPNPANFQSTQNEIKTKLNLDLEEIAYIIAFYPKKEEGPFNLNQSIGISIIGYKNSQLTQRYFKKSHTGFENIEDLNLPLNHLYTLTFNLLTQYTLDLSNAENIFTVILQNPKNLLSKNESHSKENNFFHPINLDSFLLKKINNMTVSLHYYSKMDDDINLIKNYFNSPLSKDPVPFDDYPPNCTSSCSWGSGPLCQPSSGECGNSSSGSCKVTPIENEINANSITLSNFLFDKAKFYSIRDEILVNSNLGQEYINDYYTISQHISVEDISISTLTKIVNITPKIYTAYNKYINNQGGVIINTQLKNDLKSIMLDIKSLDSGNNYSSIIDNLVLDLETNTNKTRTQIDTFLQN